MKHSKSNLLIVTLFFMAQGGAAFAQTGSTGDQAAAENAAGAGATTTSQHTETTKTDTGSAPSTATAQATGAGTANMNGAANNAANSAATDGSASPQTPPTQAAAPATTTTTTTQADAGRANEHSNGMTIALILFAILVAGGVTYAITNNRNRDVSRS